MVTKIKFISACIFCLMCLPGHSQLDETLSDIFKLTIKQKKRIILLPTIDDFYLKQIKTAVLSDTILMNEESFFIIDNVIIDDRKKYAIPKNDTLILDKSEKAYINSCIASAANFCWNKKALKRLGLSNINLLDTIKARNLKPGRKKVLYTLLPPILIRNNSVCLFFYGYRCGRLCGYGDFSLWRKINYDWIYWWNFFFFQS